MAKLRIQAKPGMVRGSLKVVGVRGVDELLCRCDCGEEFVVPNQVFITERGGRPEVMDALTWPHDHCSHYYIGRRYGAWSCVAYANGRFKMACECGREEREGEATVFDLGSADEYFKGFLQDGACVHEQGIYKMLSMDAISAYVQCKVCGAERTVELGDWRSGEYAARHGKCNHLPLRNGCYTFVDGEGGDGSMVEAACTCHVHDYFTPREYGSAAFGSRFAHCQHDKIGRVQGCLRVTDIHGIDKLRCVCKTCGAVEYVDWNAWEEGAVAELYPFCQH